MKNKGFTLIELLVVVVIIAAIVALIFGGIRTCSDGEASDMPLFYAPEFENAKSQRKMADEMQRQNDLLERQLNMQESNQTPERE